jgi:hypothetical protein
VKITAVSDVVTCSLVEVYRRCRGACCLLASIAVIEAARASETSVCFRVTTRACHLQEMSQFVFFIRHHWDQGWCSKYYELERQTDHVGRAQRKPVARNRFDKTGNYGLIEKALHLNWKSRAEWKDTIDVQLSQHETQSVSQNFSFIRNAVRSWSQ